MKNEYQKVKEEVSEAVRKVRSAEAMQTQQEEDCRRRYEEAQNAMSAALAAGDREGYREAGLTAEAARLDLEFFEKSKTIDQLPEASQDDDRRIRGTLTAEAKQIRTEYIQQLTDLFTKAATVCADVKKQLDEIDAITQSWNSTVMKNTNTGKGYPDDFRLAIAQFANLINSQLQRITYFKGV